MHSSSGSRNAPLIAMPIKVKAFLTQLKAIKRWGRSAPADLSTHPAHAHCQRRQRPDGPFVLSEDLHRRIGGSELIIYPDSAHGGIFQFHDEFVPVARVPRPLNPISHRQEPTMGEQSTIGYERISPQVAKITSRILR